MQSDDLMQVLQAEIAKVEEEVERAVHEEKKGASGEAAGSEPNTSMGEQKQPGVEVGCVEVSEVPAQVAEGVHPTAAEAQEGSLEKKCRPTMSLERSLQLVVRSSLRSLRRRRERLMLACCLWGPQP